MLGFALVAWLAAVPVPRVPSPQDTGTVDAPVYEDAALRVSLPRPFDNWVFEPGRGQRTATVIFHPRQTSLEGRLWGAMIVTPYPGRATLAQVAEQRIQVAWRPQFGRSLRRLGTDTLQVAGLAAVHFAVSGTVRRAALRAEEYLVARGRDLIVLQFRFPPLVPYDSLAAGYRRVVEGLRVGGVPAPVAARGGAAPMDSVAPPRAAQRSPWQVRSYDALVRYDSARVRADFAVRLELVNDGPVPADSASVWLWPGFALDSVRIGASAQRPAASDGASRLALPAAIEPQAVTAATYFYHLGAEAIVLPAEQGGFAPDAAYLAFDWLPHTQSAVDSSGQAARTARPRFTLSFDVPATWRAVAPGRMTSEIVFAGRRRSTWTVEDVAAGTPAFALGPYRVVTRRSAGLGVAVWLTPEDSPPAATLDSIAGAARAAWIFCSRTFGRLPIADINVVSTRVSEARGFLGLVLNAGLDTARDQLVREVARSWWGNSVEATGPGSWWIREGFPAWVAVAARGALDGDSVRQRMVREVEARWRAAVPGSGDRPLASLVPGEPGADLLRTKGVAALEAARRAAGEAAFRAAILSLSLEHRNGWASLQAVLDAIGPDAAAVLRTYLF